MKLLQFPNVALHILTCLAVAKTYALVPCMVDLYKYIDSQSDIAFRNLTWLT